MIRTLAPRTLVLAAILAVPALAPARADVTPEQTQALVAAIAAAGCEVRADNNAQILAAAGLDEAQAAEAVSALLGDGRAEIEGGTLRLKTEGCN